MSSVNNYGYRDSVHTQRSGEYRNTGRTSSQRPVGRNSHPSSAPARSRDERYNRDGDSFKRSSASKPSSKSSAWKNRLIGAAMAAIAIYSVNAALGSGNKPVSTIPTNGHSIEEIEEFTGIDRGVLSYVNKLSDNAILPDEMILPEKYDCMEAKISDTESKLKNENISDEDKKDLRERLNYLKEARDLQNDIADVYLDGDKVLIAPKYYISTEDLKSAFRIPDGEILKHNKNLHLSYTYGSDNESHYKDYTSSHINPTDIIVLPKDKLFAEN